MTAQPPRRDDLPAAGLAFSLFWLVIGFLILSQTVVWALLRLELRCRG